MKLMQNKKIQKIVKAIVFIILGFAILLHISYILRPSFSLSEENEKRNMLGYYAEDKQTMDIVYFGSSDALVYWMPYQAYEITSLTSYTYGRSGMGAGLFCDALQEVLAHQSPSLIIVSIRSIIESPNYLPEVRMRNITDTLKYSSLQRWRMIFHNTDHILLTNEELEEKTDNAIQRLINSVAFYFDIVKYHDNWEDISEDSFNYVNGITITSDTKGYLLKTDIEAQERDASVPDIIEQESISALAEQELVNIMDLAHEKDLNVLFVLPPYRETEDVRKKFNYVKELLNNNGFECLDINENFEETGIDMTTDFYNERHVNVNGGIKYTDFLSTYLLENYHVESAQGELVHAKWNEELKEWKRLVKNAVKETNSKAKK